MAPAISEAAMEEMTACPWAVASQAKVPLASVTSVGTGQAATHRREWRCQPLRHLSSLWCPGITEPSTCLAVCLMMPP